MKQSDIFTIIIIATIGTAVAYFGVKFLLGDPDTKSVTFKTVDAISSELEEPDPELFNPEAINPTVEVYVGNCQDSDQNGILSEDELRLCGKITDNGSNTNNPEENKNPDDTGEQ